MHLHVIRISVGSDTDLLHHPLTHEQTLPVDPLVSTGDGGDKSRLCLSLVVGCNSY